MRMPTDPPDKGPRYVIIVSTNAQNHHPRANTVLVVPLSTSLTDNACLQLSPGETGLGETSQIWERGISAVSKNAIRPPRNALRKLSHGTIRKIAKCVLGAMGVLPKELC